MDEELEMATLVNLFTELGCPSESLNVTYLALEVPSNVNYLPVKQKLEIMEKDEVIGYAETALSQNHQYKDIPF